MVSNNLSDTYAMPQVEVMARRCGPCKMIKPVFASLSTKHPSLVFLTVDVDANEVWLLSLCLRTPHRLSIGF